MPRDQRLYMTFPIDFDEHPKVEPLSDAAFRTFVSMNGYSRRQRLDGSIPSAVASKRWKKTALAELVQSHPERPLVLLVDGIYIIRDYAEHQFTTADESDLHEKRASAGAKGGKARALARANAKQEGEQKVAGSGSGIDKTDDGDSGPYVTEVDAGAVDEDEEFVRVESEKLGIRRLGRVRTAFERVTGPMPSEAHVVDLARAVIRLALEPVRTPEAYIEKACLNSPDQVLAEWSKVSGGK